MKKSEIKLISIELITIFILILDVFVTNIFNEYIISLFFTILSGIVILLLGYEKDKEIYKKNILFFTIFYSIGYTIFLYGIGLITGFVKSPYSHNIIDFTKIIFPLVLVIIVSEIFRYLLCKKGNKNKLVIFLTIIVFTLADIVASSYLYDLSNMSKVLELLTIIAIPSLLKNITLTDFSKKYGITQNIAYRMILELYIYILPITPNFNIYTQAITAIIFPPTIKILINNRFEEKENKNIKEKNIFQKMITIIMIALITIIIALNSNLFRYWIAVVASGSMEPTIKIGDLIIIDKSYRKKPDKLKVGDILVFEENNNIYTHRIIEIHKDNAEYSIYTKGDRKNNAIDNWIVKTDEIIGVVKFKIKYLGHPSLWLKKTLEEK